MNVYYIISCNIQFSRAKDVLKYDLGLQLTIIFGLCLHGYTRLAATHCILHPHPHFILGRGSKTIQSGGEDILSKYARLKWGCRIQGRTILHHIASDGAAPMISACSPLYK